MSLKTICHTIIALCALSMTSLASAQGGGSATASNIVYCIDGDPAEGYFGTWLASAGDVDMDGKEDFITGAPWKLAASQSQTRGYARVISGGTGAVLYHFAGDELGNEFGHSVAGVGDMNGDGYPDFLVGARGYSGANGAANYAKTFSGADGSLLYKFTGTGGFGYHVNAAGDVNGDGYADVIVGSDNHAYADVYSGIDGTLIKRLNGASGNFGRSVGRVGDLDQDGYDDVAVSEGWYTHVFSGQAITTGTGTELMFYLPRAGQTKYGNRPTDFNGDGYLDIVIGEPAVGSSSGRVSITSGLDGSAIAYIQDPTGTPQNQFGRHTDVADIDGDGVPDIVTCSIKGEWVGSTYETTGGIYVFSGVDFSLICEVLDPGTNSNFGVSVMAANVDGVGPSEIVVSELGANGYVGQICVYSGCGPACAVPNVVFSEDFESYAPGQIIESQNGWYNAYGGSIQVAAGDLGGKVANGGYTSASPGQQSLVRNQFSSPAGEVQVLGFDAMAITGSASTHNSTVSLWHNDFRLVAQWSFASAGSLGQHWMFRVQGVDRLPAIPGTGVHQYVDSPAYPGVEHERFDIWVSPDASNQPVQLEIIVDPVAGEIYGRSPLGETTHFPVPVSTLDAMETLQIMIDQRALPTYVGAEFDNFVVTAGCAPDDADPPTVAITAPIDGTITNQASISVSADITDASDTTVTSTPAGVTGALLAGGGTASGSVALAAEGSNTIVVTAVDAAGNTGANSVSVFRDTTDPGVTISSPADGSVFGAAPVTLTVDVIDATATGVVFGANSLSVAAGGGQVSGPVSLVEGSNTLGVTATDEAGNDTLVSIDVILDLSAPIVTIDSPINGACFGPGQESIGVTATIDDLTATSVTSTPAGVTGSPLAGGGIVMGTVTLVEGSNAIAIDATDAANLTGSGSITVVLDTTAPTLLVTSPGNGDALAGTIDVDADVLDPAPGSGVASVEFEVDGVLVDSLLAPPFGILVDTLPIADGAHTVTVRATDGKGNDRSTTVNVLFDNTDPEVLFTGPADGAIVSGTLGLTLSASDSGSGVAEVEVLVAGAAPSTDPSVEFPTPIASATPTGSEDTTAHPDGPLTLSARAVDDAGNESLVNITVTVDNTAPAKTLIAPLDGEIVEGVVTIMANASDTNLDTITILAGGVPLVTSATSPVSFDYDTCAGLDGTIPIEVRVLDLAGNESSCVASVVVNNMTMKKLKPHKLNLKAKKTKGSVKAELRGDNLAQLLPTDDHVIELRVPGGSPVLATANYYSDPLNGDKLKLAFDRAALVNSVRAGIAGGQIQPNSTVEVELYIDGSLIETTLVKVKGP